MAKVVTAGMNTMVTPEMMPGTDSGSTTLAEDLHVVRAQILGRLDHALVDLLQARCKWAGS